MNLTQTPERLNLIDPNFDTSMKKQNGHMTTFDYSSISKAYSNLYTIHTMDPYKPIDTTVFDSIDAETWGNEYKIYQTPEINQYFCHYSCPPFHYEWLNPYDSQKYLWDNQIKTFSYTYDDFEGLYNFLLQQNGTISPYGKVMDTPHGIRIPLKPHQRRTLYEMYMRENSYFRLLGQNMLFLCDNVGSGKSLCILALIAKSPKVNMWKNIVPLRSKEDIKNKYLRSGVALNEGCIEFQSNLIVVPHGVFFQWKTYITQNTELSALYIASVRDFAGVGDSKDKIVERLNSVAVVLVKSTMFTEFLDYLAKNGLVQTTIENNVVYRHQISQDSQMVEEIDEDNDIIRRKFKPSEEIVIESSEHSDYYRVESYIRKLHHKFRKEFEAGNVHQLDAYIDELNKLRTGVDYAKLEINRRYVDCKRINVIGGYIFQRVIFDEADSIKLVSCEHMFGKMTWCITSSMSSLLFPHGKAIQIGRLTNPRITDGMRGFSALKRCMEELRKSNDNNGWNRYRMYGCIVRNCPEFVSDSMSLPPPSILYERCYTPEHITALYGNVDEFMMRAMNAGDLDKAAVEMGCAIHSEDEIIQIACEKYSSRLESEKSRLVETEKYIERLRIEREYYDKETKDISGSLSDDDKAERRRFSANLYSLINSAKTTCVKLNQDILEFTGKINSIKERISGSTEKTCPICLDTCDKPALINCCKNVFCFNCIHQIVDARRQCPLCRTKASKDSIEVILDMKKYLKKTDNNQLVEFEDDITDYLRDDADILHEKIDALTRELLDNTEKRYLIFSEFNGTFDIIKRRLDQTNIRYAILIGTAVHIQKVIEQYKKGEIQVLLLNALHFGAGLNLQMTDEIIIYHRMNNDLEKQVIGRAQRLGRQTQLVIRYLCYDNELPENEVQVVQEVNNGVAEDDENVIVIE